MSVRGRAMALIGATYDEDPLRERFVEPPRRQLEEDEPGRHERVGSHWVVGASELSSAVESVRGELGAVDAPAGFAWLDLATVQAIVQDLALRRPTDPDMPSAVLRYRASGRRIPDDPFNEHGEELRAGTYVEISATRWEPAYPSYQPRTPQSQMRTANESSLRACQLSDARELALWMVGPVERWRGVKVQRCWKVGTPWPAPLDGGIEPQLLTADVVRRIVRQIRQALEHPGPQLPGIPARLVFDVSKEGAGECSGAFLPNSERLWGRRSETFLKVRLPLRPDGRLDDDPERLELLEAQIALVRVAADGTVVLPTDPVFGRSEALAGG